MILHKKQLNLHNMSAANCARFSHEVQHTLNCCTCECIFFTSITACLTQLMMNLNGCIIMQVERIDYFTLFLQSAPHMPQCCLCIKYSHLLSLITYFCALPRRKFYNLNISHHFFYSSSSSNFRLKIMHILAVLFLRIKVFWLSVLHTILYY